MKKYPFQDLPEGLANIEVEKGETLITPDGRTYSFPTGRKHSKGGIKILAEPGSWVASAYQKFDRGVAKKLMPLEKLNAKKGKKIPVADISKKYDTTNYFEMLENKDGRLDELRASTSQYMIAKYSAHQGNILKAQEEMKRDKGLDHDLDELDDNPNQGMMTAKMGGKLNSRKYKSGGVASGTKNGQTKKSWRKGKKMAVWMDGSWHHFGDSSMQDFRTHKSDKRKKAYYDRHKKNLQGDSSRAKAFRAYSRKTWQNGGEIDTIPAPIILPVENYDNRATPYLENWERYAPELPDNVYERRFARPRPSQEYIDSLQSLPKQRTIIDLRPMAPPKPVIRVPMPDTTRVPEPLMRGGGYMNIYQNGGYRDRDTIVPPNVMPMDTFPPKPFYDDSYKEFAPERPPMPPNPRMQPKLQNDEDFRNYRDNLLRFLNDSTRNQTPTVIPSSPLVPSVPSVPGPMPLKYGGEIPKYQNAGIYKGHILLDDVPYDFQTWFYDQNLGDVYDLMNVSAAAASYPLHTPVGPDGFYDKRSYGKVRSEYKSKADKYFNKPEGKYKNRWEWLAGENKFKDKLKKELDALLRRGVDRNFFTGAQKVDYKALRNISTKTAAERFKDTRLNDIKDLAKSRYPDNPELQSRFVDLLSKEDNTMITEMMRTSYEDQYNLDKKSAKKGFESFSKTERKQFYDKFPQYRLPRHGLYDTSQGVSRFESKFLNSSPLTDKEKAEMKRKIEIARFGDPVGQKEQYEKWLSEPPGEARYQNNAFTNEFIADYMRERDVISEQQSKEYKSLDDLERMAGEYSKERNSSVSTIDEGRSSKSSPSSISLEERYKNLENRELDFKKYSKLAKKYYPGNVAEQEAFLNRMSSSQPDRANRILKKEEQQYIKRLSDSFKGEESLSSSPSTTSPTSTPPVSGLDSSVDIKDNKPLSHEEKAEFRTKLKILYPGDPRKQKKQFDLLKSQGPEKFRAVSESYTNEYLRNKMVKDGIVDSSKIDDNTTYRQLSVLSYEHSKSKYKEDAKKYFPGNTKAQKEFVENMAGKSIDRQVAYLDSLDANTPPASGDNTYSQVDTSYLTQQPWQMFEGNTREGITMPEGTEIPNPLFSGDRVDYRINPGSRLPSFEESAPLSVLNRNPEENLYQRLSRDNKLLPLFGEDRNLGLGVFGGPQYNPGSGFPTPITPTNDGKTYTTNEILNDNDSVDKYYEWKQQNQGIAIGKEASNLNWSGDPKTGVFSTTLDDGTVLTYDRKTQNFSTSSPSGIPTSSTTPRTTPSGVSSPSSASSVPSYTGPSTTDPARLARNKAFREKYGIGNTPYNPTDDPNWVAYEPDFDLLSKIPSGYDPPLGPNVGDKRIYTGLLDLPLNKQFPLEGKLQTGMPWSYEGWNEAPIASSDVPGWQRAGTDTYGRTKAPRDQHVRMFTQIHNRPPYNPKEFLDWYDKATGNVWDTDEDTGKPSPEREISKYGERAYNLPGKKSIVRSSTWGDVNLTDWQTNPDAVLGKLPGVNPRNREQVKADINKGFSVPGMYNLHLRDDKSFDPIPSLGPDPVVSNEPLETIELPDSDKSRIEIEKKKVKDKLKKEVPVGADPEKLLYNLKQGLLAAQLAGLERDLPYYAYSPIKAVVNRFDPVNTKAAERMFNMSSEALRNSNLPEAVKQARLSDMGANLAKSVAQTGMQNYQGSLQNRNLVAQRIRDVLNRNIQDREQKNKQYFMEDAQGKFLTQQTGQNIIESGLKNYNARLAALRGRELISQLGDNFAIDPAGNLVFLKGKGVKPQYDELDVFGGDMSWINDIPYGELQALRKKHSKGTA